VVNAILVVTSYIPELFAKLTKGVKVDIIKAFSHLTSLSIATPLGVPLALNFTTSTIFKMDGHIKVKNLPTWSELRKFPISIPKLSVEIDVKPAVDTINYIAFGSEWRWLVTGVGYEVEFRTALPIKTEITVDGPLHTAAVKTYYPNKVWICHCRVQAS